MSELLERLAEIVQVNANSKQVYGDPVERDGATVIPVAKLQWGFGGGGIGEGVAERGGGGGGVRAQPAGFIIIKDGEAEFVPYNDGFDYAILAGIGLAGLVLGLMIGRRS